MTHFVAVFDIGSDLFHCPESMRRIDSALSLEGGPAPDRIYLGKFAAISTPSQSEDSLQSHIQNRGSVLALDGALYDERSNRDLADLLLSRDSQSLSSINGQFNAVIFEPMRNEVVIITDRLGSRPLYYGKEGNRHVISSKIAGIRAALSRPFNLSSVGLMQLFSIGHNIRSTSIWDNISVLEPGSIYKIDTNGIQSTRYYIFNYIDSDESYSPREWGARIASCVRSIAPRYMGAPGRKGLFLSGGLDSRLLAGALSATGLPLHAYTFGGRQTSEVQSAAAIADLLDIQHTILDLPRNYLSIGMRHAVHGGECATPFFHQSGGIFHNILAQQIDCLFVGFGGGLSGSMLLPEIMRFLPKSRVADRILGRILCGNAREIAEVFRPSFFKRYWPEVIEDLYSSIFEIEDLSQDRVYDVWNMRHRQPRFTYMAPKGDRSRFEVVAPFLDKDYVDLMTRVPSEARRHQLAYRFAIVDGFPELRDVPWAKSARAVPVGNSAYFVSEARRASKKMVRRVARNLGLGSRGIEEQFRNIADDMRIDDHLLGTYLNDLLEKGILPEEIFDAGGIRRLANRHLSGEDNSHLVGTALTVGLYLQSVNQG